MKNDRESLKLDKKIDLNFWKDVEEKYACKIEHRDVKVSVVVPTYNSAVFLGSLLYDIASQNYDNYEVIVIDASSTDRTLEVAYRSQCNVRVYSVANYNYYEMVNRGISLARGDYIQFLKPEDSILSIAMFSHFVRSVHKDGYPDFISSASLNYSDGRGCDFVAENFNLESLQRGEAAINFSACWFKKDIFRLVGRFDTSFYLRADYDIFCKLFLNSSTKVSVLRRVFVDVQKVELSHSFVASYYVESLKVLKLHFGLRWAAWWFFHQRFVSVFFDIWRQKLIKYFTAR